MRFLATPLTCLLTYLVLYRSRHGVRDPFPGRLSPSTDTAVCSPAGLDIKSGNLASVGLPFQRVAFTSQHDVARTLAELCVLIMSPMGDVAVPEHIRIAGDCVSISDVAGYLREILEEDGLVSKPVKVDNLEAERTRLHKEWKADQVGTPADFIRFVVISLRSA